MQVTGIRIRVYSRTGIAHNYQYHNKTNITNGVESYVTSSAPFNLDSQPIEYSSISTQPFGMTWTAKRINNLKIQFDHQLSAGSGGMLLLNNL